MNVARRHQLTSILTYQLLSSPAGELLLRFLGGVAAGGVAAGGSCYFLVVLVAFQISDQDGAKDQRSFIALYSDFYIYFRSPAGSARRLDQPAGCMPLLT